MSGIFGGGGGSPAPAPAPTSQTVSQVTIPDYAKPYVERMLGKGEALSDTPYQTYGGQRLAGFTPIQEQAFRSASGMQPSAATSAGIGYAGLGTLGALGAGGDYMRMATDPSRISSFMSPYMQNVVDVQKQEAMRDYSKGLGALGARAAAAGAFGGTRAALERAEAGRNLQTQLGNIQATGTQRAFEDALKNMQYGSALGLQGLQTGLQGAQALGALGGQQFQQGMDINKLQQQVGATQQTAQQQQLDIAYQDFLRQKNYPYTQLAFMSDLLRGSGVPLSQAAQQIYQAPPSPISQIAGLGLGAYGLSRMMKDGGEVKGYAAGGGIAGSIPSRVTSQMDPQEIAKKLDYVDSTYLMRLLQDPSVDQMTKVIAKKELDSRPRQAQPEPGTAGLPALSVSDMYQGMANGGIIAFDEGGDVDEEQQEKDIEDMENAQISSILSGSIDERSSDSVGIGAIRPEARGEIGLKADASPIGMFVEKTAVKYGVDPDFAKYVISKETGTMKNAERAVSPKGAAGIMQLMPGTAKDMGVKDVFDPYQNIEGGIKYLAMLEKKYGDPKLVAIAYNWGPGNTDKWLKAGADAKKLPKETQMYIAGMAKGGAVKRYAKGTMVRAEDSLAPDEEIIDTADIPQQEYGFADYLKQIRADREALKKGAEEDKNLALIQAGLGMAAGTSPYALQNIAGGAMKGVEAYGAGKKQRAAEALALSKAELGGLRGKELEEYRRERIRAKKEADLSGADLKQNELVNRVLGRAAQDPQYRNFAKQLEGVSPDDPMYKYYVDSMEAIKDAYLKSAGIKMPRVPVTLPKAPTIEKEPSLWDRLTGKDSSKPKVLRYNERGELIQ